MPGACHGPRRPLQCHCGSVPPHTPAGTRSRHRERPLGRGCSRRASSGTAGHRWSLGSTCPSPRGVTRQAVRAWGACSQRPGGTSPVCLSVCLSDFCPGKLRVMMAATLTPGGRHPRQCQIQSKSMGTAAAREWPGAVLRVRGRFLSCVTAGRGWLPRAESLSVYVDMIPTSVFNVSQGRLTFSISLVAGAHTGAHIHVTYKGRQSVRCPPGLAWPVRMPQRLHALH